MRPRRLCDGVLVSLAQNLGTKGLLRRVGTSDRSSLTPKPVRQHFKLCADQWAFGDCGAFSYVNEERPTISVEQAVSLYDLYEFDLGASVDHIPAPEIITPTGKKALSDGARRKRVRLTRENAGRFIRLHRERGARFIPVGVVQGLGPRSYARQIGEYVEMGYRHLALGGLVPRSDADARAIVRAVQAAAQQCKHRPWIHLLGIFRPSLQPYFRELGIGSFDSATYFRKAWLRSDQNYLGADGRWYAAIRVPPLRDPRTKKRLGESGVDEVKLAKLEAAALQQLRQEYLAGTTDVLPPNGSQDYYALHNWVPGPGVPLPQFSVPYRLRRAIRVIDVSAANVNNAVTQIDGVVTNIEQSAFNEHTAGNIPNHWQACGDEQDCDACDFRHFCPSPASQRVPNPPPRTPPVAPG